MSRDIVRAEIERSQIDAGEYRLRMKLPNIDELAASVKEQGLLEPIGLIKNGERYTLIYGERRFAACTQLNWKTISATVFPDAKGALLATLSENVQRRDLNPLEEAKAFRRVIDSGVSQTELAKIIGKTQSYIAQKLRFEQLPMGVLQPLSAGWISEGHVRQLLRLKKVVTDITGNDCAYYGDYGPIRQQIIDAQTDEAGKNLSGIRDLVGYWQDKMVWHCILNHTVEGTHVTSMTVRELEQRINAAIEHNDLEWLFDCPCTKCQEESTHCLKCQEESTRCLKHDEPSEHAA